MTELEAYVQEARILCQLAFPLLSVRSTELSERAQAKACILDDNPVGTEHLVLGFYSLGGTTLLRVLRDLGINRDIFIDQLELEVGPSPTGSIPLTPRALMIIGLSAGEAVRTGSHEIEPAHLLLGVIRESEKLDATGMAGPHHLRLSAQAVGKTLGDIECRLLESAQYRL